MYLISTSKERNEISQISKCFTIGEDFMSVPFWLRKTTQKERSAVARESRKTSKSHTLRSGNKVYRFKVSIFLWKFQGESVFSPKSVEYIEFNPRRLSLSPKCALYRRGSFFSNPVDRHRVK